MTTPTRLYPPVRRVWALAVLACLLVAGCSTPEAYKDWYERRQQDEADGRVVHLDASEFVPQEITVAVGTNVTWVNNDSITHTVTFETLDLDATLDDPGESVSYTFEQTGTFDYRCKPHSSGYRNWDQMVGRVTVVDGT